MSSYENVFVNSVEADDAANRIEVSIKNLRDGIETLHAALGRFHGETEAGWEGRFNEDWNRFYTTKFPSVIRALEGQVANLRTAAEAARNLDA